MNEIKKEHHDRSIDHKNIIIPLELVVPVCTPLDHELQQYHRYLIVMNNYYCKHIYI